MTNPPPLRVLAQVVELFDTRSEPVAPETVANRLDAHTGDVRHCLERFADMHLLCADGEGSYRPTITARELLALDIDPASPVILDTDPDPC